MSNVKYDWTKLDKDWKIEPPDPAQCKLVLATSNYEYDVRTGELLYPAYRASSSKFKTEPDINIAWNFYVLAREQLDKCRQSLADEIRDALDGLNYELAVSDAYVIVKLKPAAAIAVTCYADHTIGVCNDLGTATRANDVLYLAIIIGRLHATGWRK